jgi:lipopolysaccharide transport system ATP-binding protein
VATASNRSTATGAEDPDVVIALRGVSKSYSLEQRPWHRLWRQLSGGEARGPQHHALHDVDLVIRRGEAVGLVGRNGAGKSTLLQLVCGVLQPTRGTRFVRGRVAALLELGAGFNPELTGRENVRLNGPLLGMTAAQIEQRLPEIVEFAGIGDFIDQPVRSYSSGMFIRLAFSMATSVEPDILIVDEALSVGDGVFARKSFERIMQMKERGATLLFCSHSLFQMESMCQRALWIHDGRVQFDGRAHQAVVEYSEWLSRAGAASEGSAAGASAPSRWNTAAATLTDLRLQGAGPEGAWRSGTDTLAVVMDVMTDPTIPCPTLGVLIHSADGRIVSSAGSWLDQTELHRGVDGRLRAVIEFPALPLLKGRYSVSAYALCERGINVYASAEQALGFDVSRADVHQGLVVLPHTWRSLP